MANKFTSRSEELEIMDDLDSGGPVMDQTLHELEVINKWLGGNYVTISGLDQLVSKKTERLKIVDLGCGGGDMLKLIADWAREKNVLVELVGIDANTHVINFAKKNTAQYPEISYLCLNIFSDAFRSLKADIFTATLFTHHFSNQEFTTLINQLKTQAKIGLVINDLHRHWLAYHSIRLLTTIFSRSPMVKNDAAVSVLRSFRKNELISLLHNTSVSTYSIKWMWAFRWQVVVNF